MRAVVVDEMDMAGNGYGRSSSVITGLRYWSYWSLLLKQSPCKMHADMTASAQSLLREKPVNPTQKVKERDAMDYSWWWP